MKLTLQRVKKASVTIDGIKVSEIQKGLLILVGFCKGDTEKILQKAVRKIVNLRIFPDKNGKMNKSVKDIGGEILVVSQFTLCAEIKSGTRPSFSKALEPNVAFELYEKFVFELEKEISRVRTGRFQAYMLVELVNDGPITINLEF